MLKKIKYFICASIMFCMTLMACPAYSYIWPTIDPINIAQMVQSTITGVKQVKTAIDQVKNYINTIKAVGDSLSALAKFVNEIKSLIGEILNGALGKLVNSFMGSFINFDDIFKSMDLNLQGNLDEINGMLSETIGDVNDLIAEGATEIDVQAKVDEFKKTVADKKGELDKYIGDTKSTVGEIIKEGKKSIDEIKNTISGAEEFSEEEKQVYQDELSDITNGIDEYEKTSNEILEKMTEDYSQANEEIAQACEDFSNNISKFYKGEIAQEELSRNEEKNKSAIGNLKIDSNSDEISGLKQKGESIVNKLRDLQDKMLNSAVNDKGYPDEDDSNEDDKEKVSLNFDNINPKVYTLNYKYENSTVLLKVGTIYSKVGRDKRLILPRGLNCKEMGDGELKGEDGVKKIEKNLSTCLAKAKLERDYYCPDAKDEKELASDKCNPMKQEPAYNDSMAKNGVYATTKNEYSKNMISYTDKLKQKMANELDEKEEKREIADLKKQAADNQKNAFILQGLINLYSYENVQKISGIDNLKTMNDVAGNFDKQDRLYLDGRCTTVDGDKSGIQICSNFNKAHEEAPGKAKIENQGSSAGEKEIAPHVILYLCGIEWKDISVTPTEKDKSTEKEKEFIKCMQGLVKKASINVNDEGKKNEGIEGRAEMVQIVTDALYETAKTSLVNNYKSSDLYLEDNNDKKDLKKLQDDLKDAKDAMTTYPTVAQITRYMTDELLKDVDMEAQVLQGEIIGTIGSMDDSYFPGE